MSAAIIPFPVVARPIPRVPFDSRANATVWLTKILREQRGYSRERAEAEASHMASLTLDQFPQDFGAGEY